jgi:hypothetical protein
MSTWFHVMVQVPVTIVDLRDHGEGAGKTRVIQPRHNHRRGKPCQAGAGNSGNDRGHHASRAAGGNDYIRGGNGRGAGTAQKLPCGNAFVGLSVNGSLNNFPGTRGELPDTPLATGARVISFP